MKAWQLGVAVIGVGAVSLVALGVGLWAYGGSLPESHQARVEVHIDADPTAVRARVADWANADSWKHGVTHIEALPPVDGHPAFRECTDECIDFVVERSDDVVVTRILDHPDFGGTWTWHFHPDEGGTRVELVEDGEITNPIFRGFAHHVFGLDTNIRATTADLAASFR